jgi:hypothetical protein
MLIYCTTPGRIDRRNPRGRAHGFDLALLRVVTPRGDAGWRAVGGAEKTAAGVPRVGASRGRFGPLIFLGIFLRIFLGIIFLGIIFLGIIFLGI